MMSEAAPSSGDASQAPGVSITDEGVPADRQGINLASYSQPTSDNVEYVYDEDDDEDDVDGVGTAVVDDERTAPFAGRSVVGSGRSLLRDDDSRATRRSQPQESARLFRSHAGEHRGDYGQNGGRSPVGLSSRAIIFSLCAALNSCNLGYDIGVNTDAGPLVQEAMGLSDVRLEIFMGSLNFFAMIGALCAHIVSDRFGRRGSFLVSAIIFVFGLFVMVVSNSYLTLMIGRVFIGLGVGFGLSIDPMYIAEISPAEHRGRLVTFSEIGTNVGIVLGFCSALLFADVEVDLRWRYMFSLGTVLPLILMVLVCLVIPESPRWLVKKGRNDKAAEVLSMIYGQGYDVGPVVANIRESIQQEREAENAVGWDAILFPTPAVRRMLIVGVGTAVVQQVVGIDAVQYFLMYIIAESGVKSYDARKVILISLGLLKLTFIIVAGRLFDKRGRRPLFFVSLGGCSVACLLLSFNFYVGSTHPEFAIFALGLYLTSFSIGLGPGSWLIPSEVFALTIRAKAMSLATFSNRLFSTLMASTFLTVARVLSWAGFFLLLAAVCVVCALFLYLYLPETKGRALEDMVLYFAELTGDRSVLEVDKALRAAPPPQHVEEEEEVAATGYML